MSAHPQPENEPVLTSKYHPQWSRTARVIAAIFLIIAGIYALTLLAPVIQMLTFAFLLAFVMYTPTRWLYRRSVLPWAGAVAVIYLLFVLAVLGALLIIIPTFANGVRTLAKQGEQAYDRVVEELRAYTPEQGVFQVLNVPLDLNPFIMPLRLFVLGDELDEEAQANGAADVLGELNLQELINSLFNVASTITSTVTSAISGAAGFIAALLLAVFVSFLVLLDLPHSQQQIARWIPSDYHREAALLIEKLRAVWNGFFRGQVFIGFVVGAVTWAQLTLMGVPGAPVLAIFTGVISLIPTIGGFIALGPLAIVPLIQGSTVFTEMSNGLFALLVVTVNLLISQVIWNVVAPKILGDALDLPLPVIIVGVFIGAALGGVLGAFLVAPIMSTLRVIVFYVIRKIAQEDPFPGAEPSVPLGQALKAAKGARSAPAISEERPADAQSPA
ncbi:MAG: AI-2E family transporter [Aggregatilineales bacterium]